jgi:hypothetical protein
MRCSEFLFPAMIARCQHIKVNGIQCGSPALKRRKFCYFHDRWQQRRIQIGANQARRARYSLDLPILEDANSVQVALMQGLRLLLTRQIDHKTASLLFYALQTASSNLAQTDFAPCPQEVVIDPKRVAETNLGDHAWYKEEFSDPQETDEEENADQQEDGNEAEEKEEQPVSRGQSNGVNLQAVAARRHANDSGSKSPTICRAPLGWLPKPSMRSPCRRKPPRRSK